MRFVDTNVLLYAISRHPDEGRKQQIAASILNDDDLALSVQGMDFNGVRVANPFV